MNERIFYVYFVIRFFFSSRLSKLDLLLHASLWHASRLTPSWHFVGAARESNFTSVHEELLIGGSGDHTDNGVSSEFIME